MLSDWSVTSLKVSRGVYTMLTSACCYHHQDIEMLSIESLLSMESSRLDLFGDDSASR